jgi:hypothetical protein
VPGKSGFNQRGLDNPVDGAQMRACGQFGNYATVLAMNRVL